MQATAYLRNPGIIDGTSVSILEYYKIHISPFNTSGYTGVYQDKKTGKWIAKIGFKRKTYYLGSYSDLQKAVDARKRGEAMHDEFLEWYYHEFPQGHINNLPAKTSCQLRTEVALKATCSGNMTPNGTEMLTQESASNINQEEKE